MIYIITIWSLAAVILHFAGAGKFAEWPVIAVPWKWSCLCLLEWYCVLILLLFLAGFGAAIGIPLLFGILAM